MNPKLCNSQQICRAQRVLVNEGRGKGARLIYVSNGVLDFVLQESNALDIYTLSHKGCNVSFVSKNGLYTAAEDFLRRFPGGMLYTCGFDAIGNVEGHGLHGNLHTIPAEIVECRADENGVKIVGLIQDSALFGQNLVMERTIETKAFSGSVTVTDVLKNNAFREEPYCMLYHVNSAYPFVDEGAEIRADFKSSEARTPFAEAEKDTMLVMGKPVDNKEETCYFHYLNKPQVSLINRKLGKKMTLSYTDDTLPCLIEWKSEASGDYVIGLEPATSFLDGYFHYPTLAAGETVTNSITIEVEDL